MKTHYRTTILAALLTGFTTAYAQTSASINGSSKALQVILDAKNINRRDTLTKTNINSPAAIAKGRRQGKVVVITGTRFSYPLIQKWIDDYNQVNPTIQIIIESRGSTDPASYDILAEVYEQDEATRKNREYLYIGRYAILPVANNKSSFAKTYSEKGVTKDLISQLFFHDIFSDKDKEQTIKEPYTIYTRLQKAGAPIVFTKYFGYQQKDIKGKAIAGADEHLLKAILRDSTGISYLPLPLIYDQASKKPNNGLTVLPVDLNGNGRVSNDEKFYDQQASVIDHIENKAIKEINNIPIGYLHLSVDKTNMNSEAVAFLKWVNDNGQKYLHDFGYLTLESSSVEKEKSEQFISKHANE